MTHRAISPKHEDASSKKNILRDIAIILLLSILLSTLIKAFVVRSFYIPSGSMMNTLQIDDHILVNELKPRFGSIHRGEIIVFKDPDRWLPPNTSTPPKNPIQNFVNMISFWSSSNDQHLVKRVIGIPGDHVVCCSATGKLIINGVEIDEPYIKDADATFSSTTTIPFDITVPADSFWVMGDNRNNSADSRYHQNDKHKGFIPLDHVLGNAFVLTWPFQNVTFLGSYPEVFSSIPDRTP